MKKPHTPSLADTICDFRVRKIKATFFNQVNTMIDWDPIIQLIDRYDSRGKHGVGNSYHDGLLLFKMCLLQTWYGLSDYEVEDRINDSLSFSGFCGLTMDAVAPDHSTLSRFRTSMTKKGAFGRLLKELNRQLEAAGIIVKTGILVDASIVETPRKPKGKSIHKIEERNNIESVVLKKSIQPGVDKQGAWVKKRGKLHYGYKKHYLTDQEGLVLGVVTTPANVHEISNLDTLLDSVALPTSIPIKADKGYQSKKNSVLVRQKKLKNHILKKATRGSVLSDREKCFNKGVSKTRFKVERTFGSIKRWFHGGKARYVGEAKMHTQNLLEAICYNLYRSPRLLAINTQI